MEELIDYSDTQLSDDEIAKLLAKVEREKMAVAETERRRKEKLTNFHFVGGML